MLTRRATLGLFATAPLVTFAATRARAAEPAIFNTDGIAINGIDPVAYFTESAPVDGNPEITLDWMEATWQFASEENLVMFEAEPETYAPRFGGYCAFAASRGYLAPTIPIAWTVYEDRLYLNANLRAQELWLGELPDVIAAGEENWPAILG